MVYRSGGNPCVGTDRSGGTSTPLDDEEGGHRQMDQFTEQGRTQTGHPVDVGDRLLLRVEEAALRLQIGRTTMYELIRRGEIESVPIGRLRRIPAQCLDEYVAQLRTRTESGPRDAELRWRERESTDSPLERSQPG